MNGELSFAISTHELERVGWIVARIFVADHWLGNQRSQRQVFIDVDRRIGNRWRIVGIEYVDRDGCLGLGSWSVRVRGFDDEQELIALFVVDFGRVAKNQGIT